MGKLESAVAELSKMTPDAIAAAMKRRGITGRPGTVTKCPLAEFMHRAYGGEFIVGPKQIMTRAQGKITGKMPTPKPLAAFIRKFDLSHYADLIAPPPRVLGKKCIHSGPSGPSGKKKYRSPKKNHPAQDVGRWPIK